MIIKQTFVSYLHKCNFNFYLIANKIKLKSEINLLGSFLKTQGNNF